MTASSPSLGSILPAAKRGANTWKGCESAQPPVSAAAIWPASTPARRAKPTASAMVQIAALTMIWLTSLVVCPAPLGPIRVKRFDRCATTGWTAAKSSAVPPPMIASVPFSAPWMPPETGASTQPMPFFARSSADHSRVRSGRIEEKSTRYLPAPGTSAMPASPNTTSRTAGAAVRHIITMSACSATARGELAGMAPLTISGLAFSALRFHTATR